MWFFYRKLKTFEKLSGKHHISHIKTEHSTHQVIYNSASMDVWPLPLSFLWCVPLPPVPDLFTLCSLYFARNLFDLIVSTWFWRPSFILLKRFCWKFVCFTLFLECVASFFVVSITFSILSFWCFSFLFLVFFYKNTRNKKEKHQKEKKNKAWGVSKKCHRVKFRVEEIKMKSSP